MLIGNCTFFFSSRRRHTRFDCDWSSDVCSSDLGRQRHRPPDLSFRRSPGRQLLSAPPANGWVAVLAPEMTASTRGWPFRARSIEDRKSTRLNSSHSQISYAVFCLKKKKQPSHII